MFNKKNSSRLTLPGMVLGSGLLALSAGHVYAKATTEGSLEAQGKAVFDQHCAVCHVQGIASDATGRIPPVDTLKKMNAGTISAALTTGKMQAQGSLLTPEEKTAVVTYLAGATGDTSTAWIDNNMCPAGERTVDLGTDATISGWGVDKQNSRYLSAQSAGIDRAGLSNLEVAWKLVMPGVTSLRSQGAIVGSTLFYAAGQLNYLLALDTKSGCIKWAAKQAAPLRSGISYGRLGKQGQQALLVTDEEGQLQAVSAKDGKTIWRVDPRHDKSAILTGTPLLHGDRIFVPVSATDVGAAADDSYECCKGHGAVVALDAKSGKIEWTYHTMPNAKPTGKNKVGKATYGPSGAPIWASPSVDEKAGLVFAATGENTSPPGTKNSDSIIALDLHTGKQRWAFQALQDDIWNMSCPRGRESIVAGQPIAANCYFIDSTKSVLRDYDFGASPVIVRNPNGNDLIVDGQKSGGVWGVDLKTGKKVWHQQFGFGTALGGVHWGIATDGKRIFAPISDSMVPADKTAAGLYAMDAVTGQLLWSWKAKPDCENGRNKLVRGCKLLYGISAAPFVIGDVVLVGSLDGRLYVFAADTGELLAKHETMGPHAGVNGVQGQGGAIDSAGVFAGGGMVFVNSGYGAFLQQAGNTLIAYRAGK